MTANRTTIQVGEWHVGVWLNERGNLRVAVGRGPERCAELTLQPEMGTVDVRVPEGTRPWPAEPEGQDDAAASGPSSYRFSRNAPVS